MHYVYLPSVHFIHQPLHVSGIFVAHHQEVNCIQKQLLHFVVYIQYTF
jgi:hypothetical protein